MYDVYLHVDCIRRIVYVLHYHYNVLYWIHVDVYPIHLTHRKFTVYKCMRDCNEFYFEANV